MNSIWDKKVSRIKQVAKTKKVFVEYQFTEYRWSIRLWIFAPSGFPFKQLSCLSLTYIAEKMCKYSEVMVDKLPFFFG